MDWLSGMNSVVNYIEDHLTEDIKLSALAKIVGVSMYEFSRIFSFMAEMSVSEYVRRRRLSLAVFDIQANREKLIDIAVKYGYESQATFSRAFKELHGTTPLSARKHGTPLKTYPPISFRLTIKGTTALNFRIEKRGEIKCFNIGMELDENEMKAGQMPTLFSDIKKTHIYNNMDALPDILEDNNFDVYDIGEGSSGLKIGYMGQEAADYALCAYEKGGTEGKINVYFGIVGMDNRDCVDNHEDATVKSNDVLLRDPDGNPLSLLTIPPADWAVFSFTEPLTDANVAEAYARILTEWFPTAQFSRKADIPHLEQLPFGPDAAGKHWEIWMPVAYRPPLS